MRSTVTDTLPPKIRRALTKLGADLAIARKKRAWTTRMMAERLGVARSTYRRAEQGDPTVSMGVYAMALFVLGRGEVLAHLIDPQQDDQGLLLDVQRLPTRIRPKKAADPL